MNSSKKLAFYNHTPGADKSYSYRLSGSSTEVVGPAKSLEVNAGDIVDLEVYARYANLTSTNSSVNTLLTSLISAFGLSSSGGSGLTGEDAYNSFSTIFSGGPVIGGTEDYEDEDAPKAYLNYILFDEDFIPVDFGFDQVSESAGTAHEYLSLNVKVGQKGYLYIYLSNENDKLVDVFFDDLKVTHHTGVEQNDDYYAFGLAFNSYSRENTTKNNYLYNGKELQDELDLGWNDYGARMYMPDIGRWGVIDPLSETMTSQSSYNYAFNNPVRFIDLFGMAPGEATIDETEFENEFLRRRRALEGEEKTREEGGAVDILEEYYAQFGMTLEEGVALVNEESGSEDNDENTDTDAQQEPQQTQNGPGDGPGPAMAGALVISAALLADDVTVIGTVDDILIPFLLGAAYLADRYNDKPLVLYTPAPRTLPGFPGARRDGHEAGRARWKTPDGGILEWDGYHDGGHLEVYDKQGKHEGVFNPDGTQLGPKVPGRRTRK